MAVRLSCYKFVEELPKDLSCSICLHVLQNPQMVSCCENLFCEECLLNWKKKNTTCALCRSVGFTRMAVQATPRKIEALQVYCPNLQSGCQAKMAIKQCEWHLSPDNSEGCTFAKLACPYNCGQVNIYREDLKRHRSELCPKRPFTCPHCKETGEHEGMKDNHPLQCPLYPLLCPKQCGTTVARQNLPDHKKICPMEESECPFKDIGCLEHLVRQDVENHLSTAWQFHLSLMMSSQLNLKAKVLSMDKHQRFLEAECRRLQATNTEIVQKMTQVGLLLPGVKASLGELKATSFKLGQIDTVLTNTSATAIGKSLRLELSKKISKSYHTITVNQIKFRLEWVYKANGLELELLLIDPQVLPESFGCDFVGKIEPHQVQLGNASKVASIIRILAIVCCGSPQNSDEPARFSTRNSMGPQKLVYVDSDILLTLTLHEHGHVFTQEPANLKKRSCDASVSSTEGYTCPCKCHQRKSSMPSQMEHRVKKSKIKRKNTIS